MKVTILEPSGFCAGVERALDLAVKTKENHNSRNVVILGMLVHNEDTLNNLEKNGIHSIYKKNSSLEELVELIEEPSIVILTAHGHCKNIEKTLTDKGHIFVDATCPFVKSSFSEISNVLLQKRNVFYIGVKNHPESNAALSLGKNVFFIDINKKNIPSLKCDNPFVICQTTLSVTETSETEKLIKNKYKNATFSKGICNASTLRQNALMSLSSDVDGILVVGGSNSNNTKTLFNLAKRLYPDKYVCLIQNASQIKEKDLIGLNHIAISSGASTPKEIIQEIKNKLLN